MSQAEAALYIQVPTLEMTVASHSQRNTRTPRALQGEARRVGPGTAAGELWAESALARLRFLPPERSSSGRLNGRPAHRHFERRCDTRTELEHQRFAGRKRELDDLLRGAAPGTPLGAAHALDDAPRHDVDPCSLIERKAVDAGCLDREARETCIGGFRRPAAARRCDKMDFRLRPQLELIEP